MIIVLLPTGIKFPLQLIVKPTIRNLIEIIREVLYINIRTNGQVNVTVFIGILHFMDLFL
jgi:uncharacterized ubiquitin-like protein YukD